MATEMEPRVRRLRVFPGIAALVILLALGGCHNGKTATPSKTPAASGASSPSTAPCVIPQNNGGDHDADNNGGPNDGDGCDK